MKVKVRNRSNSTVHYSIEDGHISRKFLPREIKQIESEEIKKLCFEEGGKFLIENYLQISDKVLCEELELKTEPEYWYNEEDIKVILEGENLALLEDALDFAPEGVIDLIKSLAVSLPVTDTRKLDCIKKSTGFNALAAQDVLKETKDNPIVSSSTAAPARRTAPIVHSSAAPAPARV